MTNLAVRGSLTDQQSKQARTLAEVIMEIHALLLVDTSGSMRSSAVTGIRGGSAIKYDLACKELKTLQGCYPGKTAVVAWSDDVRFCPDGIPADLGGGTAMDKVLEYVLEADGLVRIILISDGQPDNAANTLEVASRFKHGIDTIFIGNDGDPGADFLKKLSRLTKGKYGGAKEVLQLGEGVKQLMGWNGEKP